MPIQVNDRVVWTLMPGPVYAIRQLDEGMALVEPELPYGLNCWVPVSELVRAPMEPREPEVRHVGV